MTSAQLLAKVVELCPTFTIETVDEPRAVRARLGSSRGGGEYWCGIGDGCDEAMARRNVLDHCLVVLGYEPPRSE